MEYFDFTTSEIHGLRIKELLELKKKERKIVGTFCVYVPEEIVMAAKGVWVGVCGGAQFSIPDAERILPRNLCPLIKSAFGFMEAKISPYYQVPDFFVGEATCDELEEKVQKGMGIVKKGTPRIMISGCPFALPFGSFTTLLKAVKRW